jgi:transcriptional regulator with XRE-family HTH domain
LDSNKDILNLGQLIEKLRREKGYSQRKFAQISGLSNTTISRIENGETHNPDIETLKILAAHLDCSESELIKLVNFNVDFNVQNKHARIKFLQQPTKKIKRYSSVSTTIHQDEQEEELVQVPFTPQIDAPILKNDAIKLVALKGMRLITLRLERNITQKELADALGLDKALISQYEGEIIKPEYDTIQRIANFFNVSVEYLTDNPVLEVSNFQERKDIFRNNTRDKVLKTQELRPEYKAIAEEIQDAGIEVADVRAFIAMIKKYKKGF